MCSRQSEHVAGPIRLLGHIYMLTMYVQGKRNLYIYFAVQGRLVMDVEVGFLSVGCVGHNT